MIDVEYVTEDDFGIVSLRGAGRVVAEVTSSSASSLYLASILHHALISGAGAEIRALAARDVERYA